MDAGVDPARADDVGARPRPVLRRPRAHQEHAVDPHPGHGHRLHGRPAVVLLRLLDLAGRRRRPLPRRLRQGLPERHRCEFRVCDLLEWRRHSGIRLHGLPDDFRDDHARPHRRRLRRAHEVLGGDALHLPVGDVHLLPDRALGLGDARSGRSGRRREGARRRWLGRRQEGRRSGQDRRTDRRRRLAEPGQGHRRVPDERIGLARLRGRHGRAHQRGHRRPRRRHHGRQARRLSA